MDMLTREEKIKLEESCDEMPFHVASDVMSPSDRINVFMEDKFHTKKMLREKIQEMEDNIHFFKAERFKTFTRRANADKKDVFLYDLMIEDIDEMIKDFEGHAKRFNYYLLRVKGKTPTGSFNLEQIKAVPICDIMPTKAKRGGGDRQMFNCPLHEDRTPSFCWYKKNNTWHCFSCGEGSSVIDLYMLLNNCDFKTAAKALSS